MATILIVEDDEELCRMLQAILTRMGHEAVASPNGLDALYQAAYTKPDLIILDLMMPWAAGDAVLGFIRSTSGLQDIPVLVLSAHPNGAQIAQQLQADLFIAKPADIMQIRSAVEQLLAASSPPAS